MNYYFKSPKLEMKIYLLQSDFQPSNVKSYFDRDGWARPILTHLVNYVFFSFGQRAGTCTHQREGDRKREGESTPK